MNKKNIPALYVHIPFCKRVCPFCSFAVMKDSPKLHSIYLNFLEKEIALLKKGPLIGFQADAIESVYFGGGTPSLLNEGEFSDLINLIRREFGFHVDCQWSIEMNPEDVTKEKIHVLRETGINRISLGVQSFFDSHLMTLGRHHTVEQSLNAIQMLKVEGFTDLNLDLMYGFPGQTKESLEKDLDEIIARTPTHISPYCLNIEPKTALNRRKDWISWQENQEGVLYEMFLLVSEKLSQFGYNQYEVSNFSLDGFQSRQNQLNWNGKNYLGVGAGAHSYLYPNRWGNVKRYVDYKKALLGDQLPQDFYETLTAEDELDEFIMIRLRLKEGLDLNTVKQRFKVEAERIWGNRIEQIVSSNLAVLKQNCLTLTPQGLFLADEIAADLAAAI